MKQLRNSWLIADIGATRSRVAISNGDELAGLQVYRNDEQAGIVALLNAYLDQSGDTPESCALAVAAPIDGDEVRMINRDWRFDRSAIASLGFARVEIVNDFHAVAWALPTLNDSSRVEVGSATHYRDGNIAVLGPGSGLGMSAWIAGAGAMCGEGGHITVASRNASEDRIVARLRERFGHVSAERVLSGPGLLALHEAIHGVPAASAEDITTNFGNPAHAETLQHFFRFLGGAAAELALITGAYGGIYIGGGIVPASIDLLQESDFRARFEDKNRYRDYMRAIPTWVITDPQPGLSGLRAMLRQGFRRP